MAPKTGVPQTQYLGHVFFQSTQLSEQAKGQGFTNPQDRFTKNPGPQKNIPKTNTKKNREQKAFQPTTG